MVKSVHSQGEGLGASENLDYNNRLWSSAGDTCLVADWEYRRIELKNEALLG